VSKLAGENYCEVFSKIYGLETVCLRYFNVFGPRQDPGSEYSAVISKFINAIINNQSPVIFGDGKQTRDFIYVDNVVEANILASIIDIESPIVMNCACHERMTLNELVIIINKLLCKSIEPQYSNTKPGDVKHSFADIRLIKEKLNGIPKFSFKQGIANLMTYEIKHITY
jgi:UDP-glucose 4-epimerase